MLMACNWLKGEVHLTAYFSFIGLFIYLFIFGVMSVPMYLVYTLSLRDLHRLEL